MLIDPFVNRNAFDEYQVDRSFERIVQAMGPFCRERPRAPTPDTSYGHLSIKQVVTLLKLISCLKLGILSSTFGLCSKFSEGKYGRDKE